MPDSFVPETGEVIEPRENLPAVIEPSVDPGPPPTPPSQILSVILELARDPALDITKLQTLMQMHERMETRQAEINFIQSLARFSAKMPQVPKNGRISLGETSEGKARGSIPFTRWEDMDKVIRPLMAEEGFTLTFDSLPCDRGIIITGTLLHRDGHHRSAQMLLDQDRGPGRNPLQAMGSTLSYGKRYTAEMLLNIVREGDDTDASSTKAPKGFGR